MKKFALMAAAAVAVAATPAIATNWSYVAVDDDGTGRWAYDLDSYTANGPVANFLARHETNTGVWRLMTVEINCRAVMFRQGYTYEYRGSTLIRKDGTVSPWYYIATDTVAAHFTKQVCG